MSDPATALAHLRAQLLQRWRRFPSEQDRALEAMLRAALAEAVAADAETITVMNPTSRSQRLRLAVLVDDRALDAMYQQEWAELAVSSAGRCYLVYRRRDGGDYAIEWSPATTLPATMVGRLPEWLALALLDSDGGDGDEPRQAT